MVNVNVMAMRKNLNSISLLLTEQVVKEPAVVEEEEQLVLADLRVTQSDLQSRLAETPGASRGWFPPCLTQ